MIPVQNVEGLIYDAYVFGLYESIMASAYPMTTKIDRAHELDVKELERALQMIQPKDKKRSIKLGSAKVGSGHDNFLNGIVVQFDLEITKQMWSEAQRYHYMEFISSQSVIHKLKSFDLDEAYIEYVDPVMIKRMKELQKVYNDDPSEENFLRMVYSNPTGIKLTARMTTNYRQLKTIYFQRKDHKLPEWRNFCKWIETLPMMREFLKLNEEEPIKDLETGKEYEV